MGMRVAMIQLQQENCNLKQAINSLGEDLRRTENNYEDLKSQLIASKYQKQVIDNRYNHLKELTDKEKKTLEDEVKRLNIIIRQKDLQLQEKSTEYEKQIEVLNSDSKATEKKFQDEAVRSNSKIRELETKLQVQSADYEKQIEELNGDSKATGKTFQDEAEVLNTIIRERKTEPQDVMYKRGDRTQPCRATCRTADQTHQGTENKTPRELKRAALQFQSSYSNALFVSCTLYCMSAGNCYLQNKNSLLVLVLLAFVVGSSAVPTHICPRGTHLLKVRPGLEVCPLCQDGVTYMTDHWHTHMECFNCTRLIDPEVEVLVTECNITHDTVIHCRSGFYRRLASHLHQSGHCVKCSECENQSPTRLCEGIHNTVCCGLPSYEAVLNKDNVYICREKPTVCTQGEYYSPHYEQCFPCPKDTYMSEDSHNNKECKLCQKVGNNSSRLLLQACNSFRAAIVDCKPGYFRHSPQESPLSDDDCSPCRTCQFVGRECTSNHDTVCCDRPEMTVTDNNTGPICEPLSDTNSSSNQERLTGKPRTSEHIQVCGQNEFISSINDSLTCQCCREGTYNDVLNHNRTSCQDCSEFSGGQLPANCRTGNDIFKNTDSGMSINRIACLASITFAVLVIVAYLILKRWKCVYNHKQGKTKHMHSLEVFLFIVVTIHMGFSWIMSVFVTNTIGGIIIISILTVILFLVACYLLYTFWNQTKSNNGNFVANNASSEPTQVMERLTCLDV